MQKHSKPVLVSIHVNYIEDKVWLTYRKEHLDVPPSLWKNLAEKVGYDLTSCYLNASVFAKNNPELAEQHYALTALRQGRYRKISVDNVHALGLTFQPYPIGDLSM